MRDSQRKRVYTAERAAFPDCSETSDPTLPTVEDIERYVKKVWGSKRVQAAFPRSTLHYSRVPEVADGRGCRRAIAYGTYQITIPKWARREWVVLHELAHIIVERERLHPKNEIADHGWHFCEVYLKLVLYMMGREAHDALKASFKKHKVKFTQPRERKPISDEQRAVLAARLAAARALKKVA
jgi:putative metallohydrolase (TIGR04338 family)